ncbi:MAG TPA: ribonuclease H family protein [Bacillota bacterium]|nr:ribonuclease H family protein [Bacillota bacterium]
MAKKYYVVWRGKQTGVFSTWEQCKQQVHGFPDAKYKSFTSKEEAKLAYEKGPDTTKKQTGYIGDSISVDAACSGNPGVMEYQGVHTRTGKQIFHYGPVPKGTNNIGEFLAIVHALAYLKQQNSSLPIYSDSEIAIRWVKQKRANTNLPEDEETKALWDVIRRAEKWLQNNEYDNEILKWNTRKWGESKADFGRK